MSVLVSVTFYFKNLSLSLKQTHTLLLSHTHTHTQSLSLSHLLFLNFKMSISFIYDVLILLEHIFPNAYQGIINAIYPSAKLDFGCFRVWNQRLSRWVGGARLLPPCAACPNTVIHYPQLNQSQRGGRKGHLYYSLVSILSRATKGKKQSPTERK